jgi:hypothetical protein
VALNSLETGTMIENQQHINVHDWFQPVEINKRPADANR